MICQVDLPMCSRVTQLQHSRTRRLLGTFREQKVPVVGFVNEKNLFKFGEVDNRIAILRLWLENGFELGNQTYSHLSLNHAGLRSWEDDVIQGEDVTRLLLAERKMKLRYFRHPYLDTGRDLQTHTLAQEFLLARGYQIAPVTLDAFDWMFNRVYENSKKAGNSELQARVVSEYLSHSDAVFAHIEDLSRQAIGYEPKQILLLHLNQLEADQVGELLALLRKRGYRFISLSAALSDPAYSLPDAYVGEEKIGWVERWAITMGKPVGQSPRIASWVEQQYRSSRIRP